MPTIFQVFHPKGPVGLWDDHSLVLAVCYHSFCEFSPCLLLPAHFKAGFLLRRLQLQHLLLCSLSVSTSSVMSHTTALLLLPLSLNHRLALSPYNPLSKHKQTNKTVDFSFCSNIKLFSALICLTPFPDSVFFHLQKCYQAFLDTKSRHTENQLGVLSPHRNIQT